MERTIYCGKCRVAVEPREQDGKQMAVCPNCGESDTVENALHEATEDLADKMMRNAMGPAGTKSSGGSGGLINITVTTTYPPENTYRFIFD